MSEINIQNKISEMSVISKLSKMSIEPINGKKYGKHKNDRKSIYRNICIHKDVSYTNMHTTTHTYCNMHKNTAIDDMYRINAVYSKHTYSDKTSKCIYTPKRVDNV